MRQELKSHLKDTQVWGFRDFPDMAPAGQIDRMGEAVRLLDMRGTKQLIIERALAARIAACGEPPSARVQPRDVQLLVAAALLAGFALGGLAVLLVWR